MPCLWDDWAVVWSPSSAAELLSAIQGRWLPHESAAFEVKKELPAPNKNSDIAVDVAAMATDGGVIIYGVAEDKENVAFDATPIPLEGVKDRISNIVTSHVREEVPFEVRILQLDDDPAIGFVVIDVPASIRAPHMVESKGEHRFYGRVPGGNRVLSEAQVALLYQRRERVAEDAGSVIRWHLEWRYKQTGVNSWQARWAAAPSAATEWELETFRFPSPTP